jgi:hypothetical protein
MSQIVVPIKKKKGKVVLRTVASIGKGKGKRDPDTLTITCVP